MGRECGLKTFPFMQSDRIIKDLCFQTRKVFKKKYKRNKKKWKHHFPPYTKQICEKNCIEATIYISCGILLAIYDQVDVAQYLKFASIA